jgi:predicted nucleic acid-binding protein
MFLLDTNAFSDLMREHPKMDAHLASASPAERVIICSVVRGEIRYGQAWQRDWLAWRESRSCSTCIVTASP